MIIESSIEHGGTKPFFHMVDRYFGNDLLEPFESKFIGSTGFAMAYLWLSWPSLMRGYKTIFQYVGIFIETIAWNFCEVLLVAGGFILFSLHMTVVWDLANGAGIPASSESCANNRLRVKMGIPAPAQGQRPEDLGHRADERKPLFA